MGNWKKDLLNELERLGEQEVRDRLQHIKYGDIGSPRYGIVERWLQSKDQSRRLKGKWHEKAWGKIVIGVIIGLILLAISLLINAYLTTAR
jgi:hypothetical protein